MYYAAYFIFKINKMVAELTRISGYATASSAFSHLFSLFHFSLAQLTS